MGRSVSPHAALEPCSADTPPSLAFLQGKTWDGVFQAGSLRTQVGLRSVCDCVQGWLAQWWRCASWLAQ